MKTSQLKSVFSSNPFQLGLALLFVGMLAGCASTPHEVSTATVEPVEIKKHADDILKLATSDEVPVTRYGRYTLVEVSATASEQDVLAQVIDLIIPISPQKQSATVTYAMRYVLLSSGYQLCESETISAFSYFPLPLVHRHLGPITIKDALSVLAGPAWQLQVDHSNRMVCFTPNVVVSAATDVQEVHE